MSAVALETCRSSATTADLLGCARLCGHDATGGARGGPDRASRSSSAGAFHRRGEGGAPRARGGNRSCAARRSTHRERELHRRGRRGGRDAADPARLRRRSGDRRALARDRGRRGVFRDHEAASQRSLRRTRGRGRPRDEGTRRVRADDHGERPWGPRRNPTRRRRHSPRPSAGRARPRHRRARRTGHLALPRWAGRPERVGEARLVVPAAVRRGRQRFRLLAAEFRARVDRRQPARRHPALDRPARTQERGPPARASRERARRLRDHLVERSRSTRTRLSAGPRRP